MVFCYLAACGDPKSETTTLNQPEQKAASSTSSKRKAPDELLHRVTTPTKPGDLFPVPRRVTGPAEPLVLAKMPHGTHVFEATCLGGRGTGGKMHSPQIVYVFQILQVIKGKAEVGTIVPIVKSLFKEDRWLFELLKCNKEETRKMDSRVITAATNHIGASRFNPGGGFTCTDKAVRLKIKHVSRNTTKPYSQLMSCELPTGDGTRR